MDMQDLTIICIKLNKLFRSQAILSLPAKEYYELLDIQNELSVIIQKGEKS
jgi:hypothetical protein